MYLSFHPFLLKTLKFLSLSFVMVLFVLLVQACHKKTGPEHIRVGVFQSMSGSEASYGHDAMVGLRMAEEEINSHGGVLGQPIELIVRDNQSKAGETSSIVRELISREHVVALIGEVASGRTLEAAPLAQRSGIPLIANSASNDKITKTGNFVFRVSYRDSQQGEVLARYTRSLGKSRAALLIDVTKDHSTTVRKSFKKRFEELGGKVVIEQSYSGGDKDFLAQLTAIQNSGADCLVIPGYYTDAGSVLKQAQSLGLKLDAFGTDSWDSADLVRVAGNAAEGAVFTDAFSAEDPDPVVQAFVEKYKKKYGDNPVSFTANAYDALMLLADAIKRAGSTNPRAIRDALAATRDFPGVSGKITFDQNRDPSKSLVLLRVQDGKFRFVRREIP